MNDLTNDNHELQAFEAKVREIACHVRETLANYKIGHFKFGIEASGRTATKGAKLSYSIADEYGSGCVTASTIQAAVEEFLRRKGFDNRNAPVELPSPGDAGVEDQVF